MNYFEIFDLPVQLKVDKDDLPKKYFELSRRFHPDFFAHATAAEQEKALEITASLNKAFKTFQNPDETIKYVLQLKGLLEEEEKYQLPPGFLSQVLEINEQLMDAEDNPALRLSLQSGIDNLQSEIYEPVKEIVEHYQDGVTSEKELLQVKEYYYKKKYLDRIRRELAG
jgi:molecular chaperone HscB